MRGLFFFLSAILLQACGGPKPFDISDPSQKYLTFGNGGGFTGAVTKFHLLEDGRVFRSITEGEVVEIGKIDKDLAKQQFINFATLNFSSLSIDDPGNVYYFLSHSDNDKDRNLTWGGNHTEVPSNLKTFHLNLTKLVRKLNNDNEPVKSAQK